MIRDERQEVLTIDAKDQNVGLFVEPPNKKLEVISKQEKPAMTTLREAAQRALEALLDDQNKLVQISENNWESKRDLAVIALRAALAEPNHDYERGFVGGMSEQVRRDVERDVMASLERFYAIAVTTEREACAKVCERLPAQQDIDVRDECAAAIRARDGV